ncbi:MAG: chemotaxis protein methyltransferase CheR [Candidatus Magnetoglobus multicellularis str. Araruama]|uniref:Chemotaxis protein methyltransferase CheR n=1 Tax=Candidatus Magnetoglobus multicellularis str. Araruama TaxID=890399 RepID=A0A1V1P2G8_9BACT|nr:MAG: chemotaxis protein methyltransferase CheR [Candidatus Magnetoglobus multicellularis str. Araruama]
MIHASEERTDELAEICAIIHDRTGIVITRNLLLPMSRWINVQIRKQGIDALDYIKLLRNESDSSEFDSLLRFFINHETFFFRDFDQLAYFAEVCLPEIESLKQKTGNATIRIWSAGCSTGEEAYTLAIILDTMIGNKRLNCQVLGTDIDPQAIDLCRIGQYSEQARRAVPPEYLPQYFIKNQAGYLVGAELRKMVVFYQLNLLEILSFNRYVGFDALFCKNVLFYFDEITQEKILHQFYRSLNPGGFLCLDYSVTIQKIMKQFDLANMGKFYYRKAF